MSFIYHLKEKEDGFVKFLCGLPFESKAYNSTRVKHKHFFGICKTVKEKGIKKCYVFGVPVMKRRIGDSSTGEEGKLFAGRTEGNDQMKECVDILKGELAKIRNDLKQQLAQALETQYQMMWLPSKVATLHQQVFPQFKNIHEGEDIVIVGCGPTLFDYTPLVNAKHISLNRAFRYPNIKFDYAFVWDIPGMEKDNDGTINDFFNYDCTKFLGKFLMDNFSAPVKGKNQKGRLFRCYSSARYRLPSLIPIDNIIHEDISLFPLADFASISFGALHFAIWTHPKRIFLVGCDTVTNGSFDGRQNPYNFEAILRGYRLFEEFVRTHYPEIEIISVNPIGLRGLFHDVYTSSFLKQHSEVNHVEILN